MRETARALLRITFGVALAACDPDDGKPTDPIKLLVAEAGPDGEAPAAAASSDRPLGADCTDKTQCASGVCFIGGKSSWCSTPCTPANAAQVCNVAPLDGTCNQQGLCRRP